jgi:hypothetical protein
MTMISGFCPSTGEELTVEFYGNFPMKDPETNIFITDPDGRIFFGDKGLPEYIAINAKGEVVQNFVNSKPQRERTRDRMLNAFGQEVLDTRPMAAAVMFSDHIRPEDKLRQLMHDANFRAQLRAYLAEEEGVDTYDEFDYDDNLLFGDKEPVSAHEMVYDSAANSNVPRFLQGSLKAVKQAVQKGGGPLAPSALPKPSPAPVVDQKAAEGEGDAGA